MALSLDVQHVITSWGEGSVFDCGEEEDALTDLLIHLDDANEDAASWLRFDTSFAQATAAPAQPRSSPAQPRSSSGAAPSTSSKGGIAVPAAPAVPWWETCPQHGAIKGVKLEAPQGGGDAKSQAFFDMGAYAYSSAGGAFAPAAGQGHQQPEQPCVVPDNSTCSVGASAAAAPPSNPYGLVPQAYMFMAPMMAVPPALAPAPSAAAAAAPMPLQGFMSETMRVRQECLRRYRDKKARRMYTKMVRYQLRKINADKRPRIKGRFVKKTEEELAAAAAGNSGPAAAVAGTAAARRRAPSTDDSAATVAKEGSESMQADYGVLSDDSS